MDPLENLSRQESISLNNRLREQVLRDPLTGLYCSSFLKFALSEEVRRSARYGYEFCVLFLDVDRFKQFNDTNGHVIGSELLARLGKLLAAHCRILDLPFRYGGDEFVLLLPQTSKQHGCQIAQALCSLLQNRRRFCDEDVDASISVSLGLSAYPSDCTDPAKLVDMADRAMYLVKRIGGGRVAAAGDGLLR